ncbi:polycomb protein Sfmbt [Anopheles maculipalpis]|uniref:polycomb protein Sfmbt n=1 Tax=Anopheles maculipalpis TaxID=1496333 RepID=UPI0021597411|nr:polycomb protein Sfmbt [Anopheles maculipalpis]
MNVFNRVLPSMNPQEFGTMVWMGQLASPLDENLTNYYGPAVTNVMEDITQQTQTMDMNPAAISSLISEYGGHLTAIPTPSGLATVPNAAEAMALTNSELFNIQQQQQQQQAQHHQQLLQQQLALSGYSFLDQAAALSAANSLSAHGDATAASGLGPPPTLASVGMRLLDGSGKLAVNNRVLAVAGAAAAAAAAAVATSSASDEDGINEVLDDQGEDEEQNYEQYQQMINNGLGNDYLAVPGQDNLLPYKYMSDPHMLQHNFLDYDVMADASNSNSSNSNSRCSPGGTDTMDVEHQSTASNQSDSRFQQQRQQEALGGSDVSYPGTIYSGTMPVERHPSKKIRPVKRPGLVLKTPIAYKGDIDPSVIPIQRDGMAICEKCGAIGVKHSFYTKQRRFCSLACARSFESLRVYSTPLHRAPGNKVSASANDDSSSKQLATSTSADASNSIGLLPTPPEQLIDDSNLSTGDVDSKRVTLPSLHQHQEQVQNIGYRFKMSGTSHTLANSGSGGGINSNSHDGSSNTATNGMFGGKIIGGAGMLQEILPQEDIPQLPKGTRLPSPCPQDDRINSIRRKPNEFHNSYDWTQALAEPKFYAAPVTCFKHAPGYDMWPNVVIGMKVEVENTDCDFQQALIGGMPHSFWVATVLRICGYKALLRYEGFDGDGSKDFWVNLCSAEVHPVGWCATRGKPLIPPKSIEKPSPDWKEFLVARLSNARTLPSTFYNKISDSFKSRFRVGLNLEVVDKNRISQVKLATISKIIGKRLYVRYYDSSPDDYGFWCHEDSPLIHPVGWATTVGHNLAAPEEYMDRMNAASDQILEPHEDDATMDLFKTNFQFEEYCYDGKQTGFEENMKLEAVDPLNLSSICVATVMTVLKFGYIMVRIDSYDPDVNGADWFCYHEKSPCIFPVGFCAKNNITLTPPKGYDLNTFTWEQYLLDTNSKPATEDIFHRDQIRQRFKVGMKLESADLMDPRLICVATIARVVGRLLKVHFDGWEDEYDQWLDSESPDIYPIGWCVLVGHKLEGPRILPKVVPTQKISPKTTKKGRRKKKLKMECPQDDEIVGCLHYIDNFPAQPAPTTRTARIKKEQEYFEQQKLLSTNPSQFDYSPLGHMVATDLAGQLSQQFANDVSMLMGNQLQMQQNHQSSEMDVALGGGVTTSSSTPLHNFIKHETNHDTSLLSGGSALGPIFDHSSSGTTGPTNATTNSTTSNAMETDDVDVRTEDEDGESSSATGLPSTAPSSEIADNEIDKTIPRLIHQDTANSGGSPDSVSGGIAGGLSNSNGSNSGLVGAGGMLNTSSTFGMAVSNNSGQQIMPESWEVKDVATFLTINDCAVHAERFVQNDIDGKRLLELSKDDIITLLNMKVGPALKIFDLIQQLKCKIDPTKLRHLSKATGKKFL